jgi:hypothetical protein
MDQEEVLQKDLMKERRGKVAFGQEAPRMLYPEGML